MKIGELLERLESQATELRHAKIGIGQWIVEQAEQIADLSALCHDQAEQIEDFEAQILALTGHMACPNRSEDNVHDDYVAEDHTHEG